VATAATVDRVAGIAAATVVDEAIVRRCIRPHR
jgi:hypothetical protein